MMESALKKKSKIVEALNYFGMGEVEPPDLSQVEECGGEGTLYTALRPLHPEYCNLYPQWL